MSQTDTFIKDIENYFLTLSEKGLMLSSKDYFLIEEWMERGISKEQIYRGISDAFEQKTKDKIRSIYDCKEHVESSEIRVNKSHSLNKDLDTRKYIEQILNNFNKLMSNEKHPNLLKLHNKFKSSITELYSSEENLFEEINKFEAQYFEQFCDYLEHKERLNLKEKISEAVTNRNDYINEESKKKALNIHLKNLIIDEYIYFNPFDTDN